MSADSHDFDSDNDVTANQGEVMVNQGIKRSMLRRIHIVFSIPIIGYIYSPFEELPQYATPTRFVFFPVLALAGLVMWKGHALRRLVFRRAEQT